MRRQLLSSLVLFCTAALWACGPVGANINNDNQNNNQNLNQNQNWNPPDAGPVEGLVKFRGRVWSPGADDSLTLEVNRFPIPGAAVAAFHSPPPELPQGMYCNECMEIPAGVPNVIADKVTGEFELQLMPNRSYYLTIQKGEFRRVRQITVPDMPDQVWELSFLPDGPRPEELTLPNQTNLGIGDNIPKIAVVDANYEEMDIMFNSLGFIYNGADVVEVQGSIVNNRTQLDQYNLLVVPCGNNWPGGNGSELKKWVEEGGKLYVDDWNYDFVEQVWPEFLTFYKNGAPCGGGSTPPSTINECNSSPDYDFYGDPGDVDLADWLALPEVNRDSPIFLEYAWNHIHELGEGIVGVSDECTGICGPNGEVYMLPKVWMYNKDPASRPPATVSWPYYCGKVLFTVYHTHSGSAQPYQLLLQEKIMMYLIMEIQTCSTGPIVQ